MEYKAVEVALMSSPVEAKTSSSFNPEKGSGDISSTVMCRTLPDARCMEEAHIVLHSCTERIFKTLVSLDSEKETTVLMTNFGKCNPPLLVNTLLNTSEGYPESLLHIALSSHGMLTSPLLSGVGR